jgi:hypothetical protein
LRISSDGNVEESTNAMESSDDSARDLRGTNSTSPTSAIEFAHHHTSLTLSLLGNDSPQGKAHIRKQESKQTSYPALQPRKRQTISVNTPRHANILFAFVQLLAVQSYIPHLAIRQFAIREGAFQLTTLRRNDEISVSRLVTFQMRWI